MRQSLDQLPAAQVGEFHLAGQMRGWSKDWTSHQEVSRCECEVAVGIRRVKGSEGSGIECSFNLSEKGVQLTELKRVGRYNLVEQDLRS